MRTLIVTGRPTADSSSFRMLRLSSFSARAISGLTRSTRLYPSRSALTFRTSVRISEQIVKLVLIVPVPEQ